MKAVLISIQPKWVEKIVSGQKTIEVRKRRPKLETPFKCYIYQTRKPISVMFGGTGKHISEYDKTYCYNKRSGKVIGEFVCDKITDISVVVRNCNEDYNHVYHNDECKGSCLTWKELQEYGKSKPLYGWHISNLKIYDKPKELSEFIRVCPEWEKEKVTGKCRSCDHYYVSRAECFAGCDIEGEIPITKAPQSWCYVEVEK